MLTASPGRTMAASAWHRREVESDACLGVKTKDLQQEHHESG
jgi:hypothetical protein